MADSLREINIDGIKWRCEQLGKSEEVLTFECFTDDEINEYFDALDNAIRIHEKLLSKSINNSFDRIKSDIDELRKLNKTERKKGNWVGIDDGPCETFECDKCGFVIEDWILGAFYNFCPNCGTDMRGGEDG